MFVRASIRPPAGGGGGQSALGFLVVTAYRCEACGNKTRFDIFETKRVRAFHHFSLGGDLTIEEEEVIARDIERVVCRWCGSSDSIVPEELGGANPARDLGAGAARDEV